MARNIANPGVAGSNASSGGGGAPTGAAGGSLTGTYPNPTIATIPSGATATTQTAADNSTKVGTTAYVDTGLALKANLAGPTFTGSPVLPTGTTGTTQVDNISSTTLATTAFVKRQQFKSATPRNHGMAIWTCDPQDCTSATFAYGAGTVLFVRLYDVPAQTFTNLVTYTDAAATSTTLVKMGMYSISSNTATLAASWASQHVAFNAGAGDKSFAINGGTYAFPGGDLLLAIVQVSGTTGKLAAQNPQSSNIGVAEWGHSLAAGNLRCFQLTGQTDLPGSVTLTSTIAASGVCILMGAN